MDSSKPLNIDHNLDHQTKNAKIVGMLTVGCVVMTAMVGLRVYTRAVITHSFGTDDVTIVVALIVSIGAAVVLGMENYYGLGHHIWVVRDMHAYMMAFYASILIYNMALLLVKVSILLLYRRIFRVNKIMRYVTTIGLGVVVLWGVSLLVVLGMLCVPISALWDTNVQGYCLDMISTFFATSVINMITDFGIWLMPIPLIWKLNLPKRQKLILAFILCLGLFTCAVSIIRILALSPVVHTVDTTWTNTEAAFWSYLELTLAMTAACIPPLRPLAGKIVPHLHIHHSAHHHTRANAGLVAGEKEGHGMIVSDSTGRKARPSHDTESGLITDDSVIPGVTVPFGSTTDGSGTESYKVSIASKAGANKPATGNGSDTSTPALPEGDREVLQHNIRATTVVKQEVQQA